MSASLQHETSQAHEASDERASASGAGHGFEAGGVTRRSSPACSPACNTRHRRHARRQMNEPAPAGQSAGSGLVAHVASIPCMFAILQHETSQAREASDDRAGASGAGRGFEACGITRRPSPACWLPCHTRHRRHARRQMKEPAPVGQGAGSRPVASLGVHLLHVRTPATRDTAGTRGVR